MVHLLIHTAKILVIDEADLAFDMGFIEDIDKFASKMPANLEMYVFSATIPEKLKPFLNKYMESLFMLKLENASRLQKVCIIHLFQFVVCKERKNYFKFLKEFHLIWQLFLRIQEKMPMHLQISWQNQALKSGRIHGDLSPRERTRMMKRIRDLDFNLLSRQI